MDDVAPPSTRMWKESESKMAQLDLLAVAAEFALATPAVIADRASTVVHDGV
jgi:hypothetical protein